MKYVYLYVDQNQVEKTVSSLKHLRFVRRVQVSKRGQLKTNFIVEPEVVMKLVLQMKWIVCHLSKSIIK